MLTSGQVQIGSSAERLGLPFPLHGGRRFYEEDTGGYHIANEAKTAWIHPWTIAPGETLYVSDGGELDLGGFTFIVPATGTGVLGGGAGAAGRMTLWSDANTLTSDASITYLAGGHIGVGAAAAADRALNVSISTTNPAAAIYGLYARANVAQTVGASAFTNEAFDASIVVTTAVGTSLTGTQYGFLGGTSVLAANAGAITTLIGLSSYNYVYAGAAGSNTTYAALAATLACGGANTFQITSYMGIYVYSPSPLTNIYYAYGLRIDDIIQGSYGNWAIRTWAGNIVFNEGANAGTDFRVEGGTLPYLFFTDGGVDRVGIGESVLDRLFHVTAADAATNTITYAKRTTHITSGTAAALFGVGEEHELEDGIGANQVASEVATLWADPQNTLESPLRRWTTYPKGAIGPAYGAFWTWRDLGGIAVPVVPNGAGDVTAILRVMYVIELVTGGNTFASEVTVLTGGGAVDLYNVGGEQFTITVAADGSVSVVRAAGADTARVGLWMVWI